MTAGRAVLLVQRIGPYHQARFAAAAKLLALDVIEFRVQDGVYAWDPVTEAGPFRRHQAGREDLPRLLDTLNPPVLVTVGYADPEVQTAVRWAIARERPVVVCSDSTHEDEPRRAWKEALKRTVLGAYDAGLAAGSRSTDYLVSLGLPRERIHRAWDVVDNEHFARGAAEARTSPTEARRRLGLPERYWLTVARFVPKKNLEQLITAYARHVRGSAGPRRSLVLSGAGPLEADLRARARAEGVEDAVCFPGFLQYADLPACYGLADAFVLPSRSDQWGLVVNEAMAAGLPVVVSARCGCADDLVEPGRNGLRFEPADPASLVAALDQVAALDDAGRAAWGRESQTMIRAYSLDSFAEGLAAAVASASAGPRRKGWGTRLVLPLLGGRRIKTA